MKKYRCIPIATSLPIAFTAAGFVSLYMAFSYNGALTSMLATTSLAWFLAIYTVIPAVSRIEIHSDRIICKKLLPQNTFEIKYDTCSIGMDYHVQNGNKIWWIYICEGAPPKLKASNPANRINSVKIKPGFVKIMYSDEVYEALMAVLPKKQHTALLTSRRCAGFEKQGRIVL